MNNLTIYKSVIDSNCYSNFKKPKGYDLFSHACNCNSLEDIISISYLLCPDFIKIKNYIFVSEFFYLYGDGTEESVLLLEKKYNYNKTMIEKHINSWSINDLFINCTDESYTNTEMLEQFGKLLVYNWERRLKELFPEKNFVVELAEEIMGEFGLSITLYEI